MWFDLDPDLRRELQHIRRMVALQRQMPTREWPMIASDDDRALLVVREWPDGTITAYLASVGD
jgi:hypothetical protein